jgi:hypothetical protein
MSRRRNWVSTVTSQSTYIEYHSVQYVPSSELGLSQPLSRQRVCPSLRNQRGGTHSPAGEGLGESQSRRLENKPSTLPTLCVALSPLPTSSLNE